jgi:hypothetical protein
MCGKLSIFEFKSIQIGAKTFQNTVSGRWRAAQRRVVPAGLGRWRFSSDEKRKFDKNFKWIF